MIDKVGVDLFFIKNKKEVFLLVVFFIGKLVIVGSDKCGIVYGVMEFLWLIGVFLWEWWVDVIFVKKEIF